MFPFREGFQKRNRLKWEVFENGMLRVLKVSGIIFVLEIACESLTDGAHRSGTVGWTWFTDLWTREVAKGGSPYTECTGVSTRWRLRGGHKALMR